MKSSRAAGVLLGLSCFCAGCADVLGLEFDDKRLARTKLQILNDPALPDDHNYFGTSLDISGDTLLVGCPAARAYVAQRSDDATWLLKGQLVRPDTPVPRKLMGFGGSVALQGEWAIVADWGHLTASISEPGEAFLFRRGADGAFVNAGRRLEAGVGQNNADRFGWDIAIHGNTAAVGAPGDTEHGPSTGAVYVYTLGGAATWQLAEKLTLSGAQAGDEFGYAVALEGDTLVASAPGRSGPRGTHTGAALVFTRSGSFGATEPQVLWPADQFPSDYKMQSLSLSGDRLIAGAPLALGGRGVAYIYERSGDTWDATPAVFPRSEDRLSLADKSNFGTSVAIAADLAVIGARDPENRGSAYVYRRAAGAQGSRWSLLERFNSDLAEAFGLDVQVQGRTVLIGAPYKKPAGNLYVFDLSAQ
ncbi:MAG TPA: hypothetical protein VK524_18110 [Polyangiaceae bacterium]|nr:hypothetical protein [Polyangiaceae bacterium]